MQKFQTLPLFVRRLGSLAAAAVLAAPLSATTYAQQVVPSSASADAAAPSAYQPGLGLQASLHSPFAFAQPNAAISEDSSSSSSSFVANLPPSDSLNLIADPGAPGGGQPPPYRRRRYGRPSYSDRFHNADGSSRIAILAGGGFNVPVGSASSDYLKTSWRVEGGVGYNFNQKLGVIFQFDWDQFGLPGRILANQQNLYATGQAGAFAGLDGNTHIWSFTLNPTYTFYQSDTLGAYAVVGGGYYHKVTNFTLPVTQLAQDYFGNIFQYQANQTYDHYTSNAPGVTGGVGITYKFSRFASQRFFAEVRYVHTFNQARFGDPAFTGAATGVPYNLYPPNSNETSYIPITFGIRF